MLPPAIKLFSVNSCCPMISLIWYWILVTRQYMVMSLSLRLSKDAWLYCTEDAVCFHTWVIHHQRASCGLYLFNISPMPRACRAISLSCPEHHNSSTVIRQSDSESWEDMMPHQLPTRENWHCCEVNPGFCGWEENWKTRHLIKVSVKCDTHKV